MDDNKPLDLYPFPNKRHNSYISLNGLWNYKLTKDPNDFTNIYNDILVPYPIESPASLVNKRINKDEYIIYKKEFTINKDFIKKITFINFLGVDQIYYIILNGIKYDIVEPLNLPTKIDISSSIKTNNELIVVVKDNLNPIYPLGKQSNKPKGIFYTPFSGIYYPVFIESFNDDYIKDIKISTTLDTLKLYIDSSSSSFNIIIKNKNNIIYNETVNSNYTEIKIENPILWELDNPHLYDLEIKTSSDKLSSYFGLRTIELKDNFIFLNNQKIFLNGILDQGYYNKGLVTPMTYEDLEYDIKTMKELGFNTLRKHLKVEIPYYYYLCDKYGMLVIQDFVNNGKYNFLFLTALPTIGMKKFNDKLLNLNKTQRSNFITCGKRLIEHLSNHPSIIAYTIFNEGWGQFESNKVYNEFKTLYPNIIFDTTSGWFNIGKTDIISHHLYLDNINKLKKTKNIILLSEFGALCYKEKDHYSNDKKVFGYHYYNTKDELEKTYIKLFEEKIIPYKDKLVGIIYTQLSDIESEDNGLFTYDRKVLKINKDIIKNISMKLK